jgi:hypothetical protein
VQIVVKNARFLLNQQKEGLFIAGSVTRNTGSQDLAAGLEADPAAEEAVLDLGFNFLFLFCLFFGQYL